MFSSSCSYFKEELLYNLTKMQMRKAEQLNSRFGIKIQISHTKKLCPY